MSPDGSWVHCYRCGWSGSRQFFEKTTGIKINFEFSSKIELPCLDEFIIDEGVPVARSKKAYSYLQSRNAVDYAILNKWKCTPEKIIIPVCQYGTCVGSVSRYYEGLLRYKFSDGFKSALLMFNFDNARYRSIIILNEGVFDVISTSKALPFCGVVGLFGKHLSCYNATRIRMLNPKEIVIMLDSPKKDTEIKKSVSKISLSLCGMHVSVATLQGGDPNESTTLEIQEAFKNRRLLL